MALNIKNAEVERLAGEIARLTNTSKTEAIRQALLEKRDRVGMLAPQYNRREQIYRFMETQIWPGVPASASRAWTKDEEDAALGYGESGEPV
ncbi:MAG TPA: type II toxin-antitoxin system VapB family antitoxin [Bryobacteraceae bacterium]|nr:type II toxin-antitoxin system VapB family antitoxin [Bryobacteraceae bacterium]